jgi:predicted neutral ceramidase superfamily lipid hydrolase
MLFAQVFSVRYVERDLLQVVGLAIAAMLLSMLAWRHARSDAAKRPRLTATLCLIAVITVVWTAVEAAVRLCTALAEEWSRRA